MGLVGDKSKLRIFETLTYLDFEIIWGLDILYVGWSRCTPIWSNPYSHRSNITSDQNRLNKPNFTWLSLHSRCLPTTVLYPFKKDCNYMWMNFFNDAIYLFIFRFQARWSYHRILVYWWVRLWFEMCKEQEMSIIQLVFWRISWQQKMWIERPNRPLEANRLQGNQRMYLLWKR